MQIRRFLQIFLSLLPSELLTDLISIGINRQIEAYIYYFIELKA